MLLFGILASATGHSGPKDKAVDKTDRQVMETHFLTANYAQAIGKLKGALKTCGASGCSAKVRARILMHLGIIYVNQSRADDAEAIFVDALHLDRKAAPEGDYSTPEVEKVFKRAKAKAKPETNEEEEEGSESGEEPEEKRGSKAKATEECSEACEDGELCVKGVCKKSSKNRAPRKPADHAKDWFGLHVALDLAVLGSQNDACSPSTQKNTGYRCFRLDGSQYHGLPRIGEGSNSMKGGVAPGTYRILFSYDRLVGDNLAVGGRLGYAFNGGPKPDAGSAFLPVHAEMRLTYWFGNRPFTKDGLRPFAFASVGAAQIDAKATIRVLEDPARYDAMFKPPPANCTAVSCVVGLSNGQQQQNYINGQPVDIWHRSGPGFIAIGGGAMYAVSRDGGLVGALKATLSFPATGIALTPELGYAIGF